MENMEGGLNKVTAGMDVSVGYVILSGREGRYMTTTKVLLTINPESGELNKFTTDCIKEALIFESKDEAERCRIAVGGSELHRVIVFIKEGDTIVEVELSKTKYDDEYLQSELKKLTEQMERHRDIFERLANK